MHDQILQSMDNIKSDSLDLTVYAFECYVQLICLDTVIYIYVEL